MYIVWKSYTTGCTGASLSYMRRLSVGSRLHSIIWALLMSPLPVSLGIQHL